MDTLLTFLNYSALAAVGVVLVHNMKETTEMRQTKESILNCESYQLGSKAKLDETKPEKRMAYVELPPYRAYITRNTFIKRRQSIPVTEVQSDDNRLLQGECGDSFDVILSKKKLRVDMNECNIDKHALDRTIQPIKLHQSHNYTHFNLTYTLKTTIGLGLIGSLRYNIEARQFVLEPFFLTQLKSKQDIMSIVTKFYNEKLSFLFFKRMFCFIAIGFLCVTAFYRTFGGKKRILGGGENKVEHVQTRANERLKCACGQNMNVVSECGHLSMCKDCLQKDRRCRICGQNIKHPRIIFI